jgi:VanZ family protein
MRKLNKTSLNDLITPKRCLLAAFLFFLLMVCAGAIPGKAMAASAMVSDKLLHFTAYSILSILLYCGMSGTRLNRGLRTFLLIGVLGGLDEVIQSFLPYRTFSRLDWEINMLAAAICVSFLMLLHPTYTALMRTRRQEKRRAQASRTSPLTNDKS